VTATKFYGANNEIVSIEKVVTSANGSVAYQHYDANNQLLSADLVKPGNGTTTVYHYDGKFVLTGVDQATIGTDGVVKEINMNAAWKQTGITYIGTDRADVLTGSSGTTHFHGGLGSDTLKGGSGIDYFHFDTAIGQGDVDIILSFNAAQDKVVLDHKIFDQIGSVGSLDPSMFAVGTKAANATTHILYDKATGDLFYDADGNGAQAPILLAHISSSAALTASNFLVS
jgi:Ca2+-binding RTX toxin-like protein